MATRYLSQFRKSEIYGALLYNEDIELALDFFELTPLDILPYLKREKLVRYAKNKLIEHI